jgi:1,2-phenylacetyl-CoA epoxidase PaaB subunit
MSDLSISLLADNTKKSLENSRDNATFRPEERDRWLSRGVKQSDILNRLVGAKLSEDADAKIIEANTQLKKVNDRLKDKLASSSKLNASLKEVDDSLAILNILVGLIVPA